MYPTTEPQRQRLKTFTAALGAGEKTTSLVSPANTTRHAWSGACWVKFVDWVRKSTFFNWGEKRRRRRGKEGGIYQGTGVRFGSLSPPRHLIRTFCFIDDDSRPKRYDFFHSLTGSDSSLWLAPPRGAQHIYLFLSLLISLFIMLSRAVLPLTRPNIIASTVRISTIQHPRWYANKSKPNSGKNVPPSKPSTSNQPGKSHQQPNPKQSSAGNSESGKNADSQNNSASRSTDTVSSLRLEVTSQPDISAARKRPGRIREVPDAEASPRSHARYPVDIRRGVSGTLQSPYWRLESYRGPRSWRGV